MKIILQASEGREIAHTGGLLYFLGLVIWGMGRNLEIGHRNDTGGRLGLVTHTPLARALRHLGSVEQARIHCGSHVVGLE